MDVKGDIQCEVQLQGVTLLSSWHHIQVILVSAASPTATQTPPVRRSVCCESSGKQTNVQLLNLSDHDLIILAGLVIAMATRVLLYTGTVSVDFYRFDNIRKKIYSKVKLRIRSDGPIVPMLQHSTGALPYVVLQYTWRSYAVRSQREPFWPKWYQQTSVLKLYQAESVTFYYGIYLLHHQIT